MKRIAALILVIALFVPMFEAFAATKEPITFVELDENYMFAPLDPAPTGVIINEKGLWMRTGRDKKSKKMVLVVPGAEFKMLAKYPCDWWRVSVELGEITYTGYVCLETRTEGKVWQYVTADADPDEGYFE